MNENLHLSNQPHQLVTIRAVNQGLVFGVAAAHFMLLYFFILLLFNINTLPWHIVGKIVVLLGVMYYAYASYKENRKEMSLKSGIKLGLSTAFAAAATLVFFELIVHLVFGFNLAPETTFAQGLPTYAMFGLLALELMAYGGLIAILFTLYYRGK